MKQIVSVQGNVIGIGFKVGEMNNSSVYCLRQKDTKTEKEQYSSIEFDISQAENTSYFGSGGD